MKSENEINSPSENKKTVIPVPVRIIAAVLAVIMIAGLVSVGIKSRDTSDTSEEAYEVSAEEWLMQASSAYQDADYEGAASAMKEYAALSEMTADEWEFLVSAQLLGGRYEDAIKSCDEALKAADSSPAQIYFLRCKGDFFLEDYAQCRSDALAAKDAGYDYQEAMTMVAAAYEGEKDYAGVLNILMEIIDSGTEDESVYTNALSCALEVSDYEAQKKLINHYLSQEQDAETELSLRSQLAMAQLQSGEYDESADNINICLEANPDSMQFRYLRGVCLMNQGKYSKAYDDFSTVMKAGEYVDECHYNRAVCYIGLGKTLEANTELKEIISRNENPDMVELAQELLDSINNK